MFVFWFNDHPLFIHRMEGGSGFEGPRFATVDEGDEMTVISTQGGDRAFGPYACITMGPFDLNVLGVLALVSDALSKAKVPIFVISTYRHDHILVPLENSDVAARALRDAGLVLKQ